MKEKKGCGNGGGEKGKLKSLRRKGVYKLFCCHFVLNCNLFTHGALKSSEELVEKCPCDPDRIGIWNGWVIFYGKGKTGVHGEKHLGEKKRTNNKLNPHMASTLGFETRPHW